MIFRTPMAFLLLLPIALAVWQMQSAYLVRLFRALLLVALTAALANPVIPGRPVPPPLLVMVDQSASLPLEEQTAAWSAAQALANDRGAAKTTLAAVGQETRIVPPGAAPDVHVEGTDLGAALRMAESWGGPSVLISDGGATNADTDQVAQRLRQAGVVVDVVPLTMTLPLDARVAAIEVPTGIREGQHFAATIRIDSTQQTRATLHLYQDGSELSAQPVTLGKGQTTIPINGAFDQAGLHTLRATLDLKDAHPENNSLDQVMTVGPTPRVLVVERTPDSAATLRNTLEKGGVQSEARRPGDLPVKLGDLQRFDTVILDDVPATDLSTDQQTTLREYVRRLGHGLLTVGGPHSFGLGSYKDTPLESVLPVDMKPPPRRERQQVALLLIIDRSASMYGADPATSKLEMAKSGALAATQSLVPDDRIGVITFDTETVYVVPFTQVGEAASLAAIQNRISDIRFGGGTDIYTALATGLPDLARQPVAVKHAVLLTDGRSYTRESYDTLVSTARSAGVTLSTIAIGEDADTALLQHLAQIGGGRYHYVSDPRELPRLTLEETDVARTDVRVLGTVHPEVASAHPALRGLVPAQFPTLDGYVATTPKAEADTLLRSPSQDSLLAAWQFGLGRSVAWTSDDGGQWAMNWQKWGDAALFWSQLMAFIFPDPNTGPLSLTVTQAPDARIVANAINTDGHPLDLADVVARVTDPKGASQLVRLKQTAPGEYTAALAATDIGGYSIGVALTKGSTKLSASTGFVRPYAAEYLRDADPALLARIAGTTGGHIWPDLASLRSGLQGLPGRPERPFWPWLAGLALLLWLLEIGARRGYLRLSR